MKKSFVLCLALILAFLSYSAPTEAATIIDKSTTELNINEYSKATRTLTLVSGASLGIYVDLKNTPTNFKWYLRDTNYKIVDQGYGDANKIIGAPAGNYVLILTSNDANAIATGILSIQK
ncbi:MULTISPECIES: hypothetical protein [Cytobacillus]|uniref:hypothetical protein n=1 Tax=Cytobacillus TaxID=2675230 RepID=UPI00203B4D34|nr:MULTISPECIES: hypothetical protein [Cytobacillus]MCM3394849.1 hypothetical protein [Cytobacillus oceanisediminis]UQX56072.1 hypothetical protein M5V91_10825 [Cytobacillus pseudoceanisediminis]